MAASDDLKQFYSAWTDEGWLKGQSFQPRKTDIFVAGSPKTGTTWVQMIIHQLRTGGDMDFAEMFDLGPIVEFAHDLQIDLDAEQKAFPRCFKTHMWYPRCPKGARYIWIVREPYAVAYSFFNMLQGWFFLPEDFSAEDYVKDAWLPRSEPLRVKCYASYFHHLTSWWPHRNDPNVLLVFYEDLKECYESSIRSIAKFMGITDEGHIQVALERGTFEFMKQHSDKFCMMSLDKYCDAQLGLSESGETYKSVIRTGTANEGLEMLSAEIRCEVQKEWVSIVTPVTGCATYQELREAWKKEKQSKCSTAE